MGTLHGWPIDHAAHVSAELRPARSRPGHAARPPREREEIGVNSRLGIAQKPWTTVSGEFLFHPIELSIHPPLRTILDLGLRFS